MDYDLFHIITKNKSIIKDCYGFSEIHLIIYCTYKQKSQKATFSGEIFSAFIVLQESFVHLDCKIWLFFAWTVQESNVKLFWWALPGTAIANYVKIGGKLDRGEQFIIYMMFFTKIDYNFASIYHSQLKLHIKTLSLNKQNHACLLFWNIHKLQLIYFY